LVAAALIALALAMLLAAAGGFLMMNQSIKSQPHVAASPLVEPHRSARRNTARQWQEALTKGRYLRVVRAFLGGVVRNRRSQA